MFGDWLHSFDINLKDIFRTSPDRPPTPSVFPSRDLDRAPARAVPCPPPVELRRSSARACAPYAVCRSRRPDPVQPCRTIHASPSERFAGVRAPPSERLAGAAPFPATSTPRPPYPAPLPRPSRHSPSPSPVYVVFAHPWPCLASPRPDPSIRHKVEDNPNIFINSKITV
jgi:hypothetical protein